MPNLPHSLFLNPFLIPTWKRVHEGKARVPGLPHGAAGHLQKSASHRQSPALGGGPSAASCVQKEIEMLGGSTGGGTAQPLPPIGDQSSHSTQFPLLEKEKQGTRVHL